MRIAWTNELSPETSTTRGAFGFHTLDAIVPIEYRARFIGLFGFINVGGTVTGYAAVDDALVYMQPRNRDPASAALLGTSPAQLPPRRRSLVRTAINPDRLQEWEIQNCLADLRDAAS